MNQPKMDLDKDSLGLDFKDMDSSSVDTLTVGIDSIAQDCDFSELVDSIYNDKVQLFSNALPDSPPDSGSEHLLSPQSTTNSTYSMTPNQLDVSNYNNQYMESSPATTLSMSPPTNGGNGGGLTTVLVENEMMYPTSAATINIDSLITPIEKDNVTTAQFINGNGQMVRNTGILRKVNSKMKPSTSTISHENVYPDLSNVDYDMPRQIMEGQIPRKGSLPLYGNNKVVVRGAQKSTNVQNMANFSNQYGLTENIIIKDEESDGISNLGYADEGTQSNRKRKMTSISETNLGSPFMQDSIKIENDFIARSPNDSVYQPSPRSSISSSAKSRRNVSGSRNSMSSESGFVSPLHQQSSNKSGQSISFSEYDHDRWGQLVSQARMEVLAAPEMDVNADKGFNFSSSDNNFIVQKKNHFQLSIQIRMRDPKEDLQFVKLPDGYLDNENNRPSTANRSIDHIQLNFYGIKTDSPSTKINIEQSQGDRKKTEFFPLVLGKDFTSCGVNTSEVPLQRSKNSKLFKVSVGRLHFAETTCNNMRKKGKPNPAQKYFQLVVSLDAVIKAPLSGQGTSEGLQTVPLVQMISEKIIVRASNPGQFDNLEAVSESNGSSGPWCKDPTSGTVYHLGNVGINTNNASEALAINGNIQMTGAILQPSDRRIKKVIRELDSGHQLENVNKLKIVEYQYKPEYLHQQQLFGFEDDHVSLGMPTARTGVIAQDVAKVLPDAVYTSRKSQNPFISEDGDVIDDVMIVDKERLFLENIGAVHQLSKISGDLGDRIDDLEKANESVAIRLSRLKRGLSIYSTASDSSSVNSSVKSTIRKAIVKHHARKNNKCASFTASSAASARTLFQNRCVQAIILLLVAAIAVSVVSMASLYIVEYQNRFSDTSVNNFHDPLSISENGGTEHENKEFEKIRKDTPDHENEEQYHHDSIDTTTLVSQNKDKEDKINDSPADERSGQKEVIPQNDINQRNEDKGERRSENNTQKKDIKIKNKDETSKLSISKTETESTTNFVSAPPRFKTSSKSTTIHVTERNDYSTLEILVDHTEREDEKEFMRYVNVKTTSNPLTSKKTTTDKVSTATIEPSNNIKTSSSASKSLMSDFPINLLHKEEQDVNNEITTEQVNNAVRSERKNFVAEDVLQDNNKEELMYSSLENLSNETELLNEIDEQHRTNAEPRNSLHRSTLSPSNNMIHDDYVEKIPSGESESQDNTKNLVRDNSEEKIAVEDKEPIQQIAPLREDLKIRERMENTYKIESNKNEDSQNGSADAIPDQDLNSRLQNVSSESLDRIKKKNSSDNEVEDYDDKVKKNVSIDFILDEQSDEEKHSEKVERPNRTIANVQGNEDDTKNSIFPENYINDGKENSVSDEVKGYQNENITNNEEKVYEETYLNEVKDEKVESESNDNNDNGVINADFNSEDKVSSNENSVVLSSDDRNENENLNYIHSNENQEKITEEKLDEDVVFANTIEPESEQKIKKLPIKLKDKTQLDSQSDTGERKVVDNQENNEDTSIIDNLPDYQDEDNNFIDKEDKLHVKSQLLSKPKERQIFAVDENSTSLPSTFKDGDEMISKKTNVSATNGSGNRKIFTTTTKESLNEVESDKNSRNEAMYDKDDKINELGKDLTPVLLNQRAKRQTNEFVSNFILLTKRFLRA